MRKIVILASVILIIVIGSGFFLERSNKPTVGNLKTTPTISDMKLKNFKSSTMDILLQIPSEYSINEKSSSVLIFSNEGSIFLNRTATDFSILDDYIKDLDEHNKTNILSDEMTLINGSQVRIRVLKYSSGEKQKVYIFYYNGWIFSLYTNLESLYSDLDQIAQSFRYTP